MLHLRDLTLVCLGCGRKGRRPALAGRCECGARNWLDTAQSSPPSLSEAPAPKPHRGESGPRALGDDGPCRLIVDQYPGSAVATALEGIGRGMVVMLVGTAGVGKSTLAAQAGFMIARQLGGRLYWLDADQLKDELIEETFRRARCPPEGLKGRIIPIYEQHENGMPDFRRACARVPEDGVQVVDSLEAWAPRGDKQALEMLRVLRAHPCRVKLVIAATNAAGGVAGDGELERAGDATVFVERTRIRVGKCRWTIGSTWARFGPGGLQVERLDEGEETVGAPSTATATQGAPADPHTFGDPRLSQSERIVLARVLRWWPLTWSLVTAREIVEAVERDQMDELGAALREFSGAGELNATNVGYALRCVKDKPLNGMMLTSEFDRKAKIARWSVVHAA
jgi:hypothetical protein